MRTFSVCIFNGIICLLALVPALGLSAVEVIPEAHHDVSAPLSSMSLDRINAAEAQKPGRTIPLHRLPMLNPPRSARLVDSALQPAAGGPLVAAIAGVNMDGVGNGFIGPQGGFAVSSAPSDANGAVGTTQYVQWVNTSFAVFNKSTGAVVFGPAAGNSLWAGFGGPCEAYNDGDPVVAYDKTANRWVMSQLSVEGGAGNYAECVAVSATSDATGNYFRYAFPMPSFDDYPKLGVWPDAYYMSFNMFTGEEGSFLGARACALDRSAMLAGAAAAAICFQLSTSFMGLLPADRDGVALPPAGSPEYFVSLGAGGLSLSVFKFHVDFATPTNSTFTGPVPIPVARFVGACGGGTCIPQPGTTQQLDSLGDRLMHRLAYRNFGDHESLVANHSVATTNGAGIRWYEIRNPGSSTPTLFQQGTYSPDSTSRWMGSIAMDRVGDIAVGYSASSVSVFPSIRYTGRIVSDASGTLESENTIVSGDGVQLASQTVPGNRWGDYSGLTVDPVDDCTFWYTNQYIKTTGSLNWSTRIASFKFPNCISRAALDIVPIIELLLQ